MLKIYEDLYEISFNDKTLELTPKEYELLKILIKESNKLLSKSELRELVRKGVVVEKDGIFFALAAIEAAALLAAKILKSSPWHWH